jgi:hypothetical protein
MISPILKVCTINSHGLKGNILYINYLVNSYDVIFINEHWLTFKDKFIIENLCKEKQLFFQEASSSRGNRGRPSGGLAWITNKNINVISQEFFSNNLSQITLEHNSLKFMFFGVYAFFNKTDNFVEQANLFGQCKQAVEEGRGLNYNIFILGDFNSDPYRNNNFDRQ